MTTPGSGRKSLSCSGSCPDVAAHFTLGELAKSDLALRRGIDNRPPVAAREAMERVIANILEPVRTHYGRPVFVRSGYRCPELNALCGSHPNSQHLKGEAVDFEVSGTSNLDVAHWIKDALDFDQLIAEFCAADEPAAGWVHCSWIGPGNRNLLMTIDAHGSRSGLPTRFAT